MNNEPIDYSPIGTIRRQAERIRKLEDARAFWLYCFLLMTAACIIVTALKCQH